MKEDTLKAGEHSSSKKILIATGIYPPDIGGPATYSKQLFDHLPLHGFSVYIMNFSDVRNLPRVLRHFVYLLKLLKAGKTADIIFAQDPVSVGLPAYLASKILRKKFILKVVGDYAWEQYCQKFPSSKFQFPSLEKFQVERFDLVTELRRKTQRYVASNALKVIVPSNYLKKIVTSWGVSDDKIFIVYNSFDYSTILENRDELRREYNIDGNIIVSAGRLVPWKGFDALIETMPDILKSNPHTKLLIIGDGPERKNLDSKILDFGIKDNVIMLGRLSHEEVLAYLKASDIFILNTAYEGFSHQLLEVMESGIPIITTAIGGNREIIKDGENGIFIEFNDKKAIKESLLRLLFDKEFGGNLSKEGKGTVKNFSKERMINETIKILI
ncbi:MAG: glycosyltransferase family 4 protein [Parcubacteria group bacterium]|nr:glycosyltransferase family 4 protein [Parcubacteria group bacterium]MCR4342504.1 glycosyltransferase family 4 protein [Patescibacteria group bacterium]